MGQKFQGRRVQYELLGLGSTGLVTAEMYDFDVETAVLSRAPRIDLSALLQTGQPAWQNVAFCFMSLSSRNPLIGGFDT